MSKKRPRPELTCAEAAPHYDAAEAARYSAANVTTQSELASCCLAHLRSPPPPLLLLDLGCGSGLSTTALTTAGHVALGIDVARDMIAMIDPQHCCMPVHSDLSQGLPLRAANNFDGAISVSALQWLKPDGQRALFTTLAGSLRPGASAVLQFYPPKPSDALAALEAARHAGLSARLAIDMPHASSRARKLFLTATRVASVEDVAEAAAVEEAAGHALSPIQILAVAAVASRGSREQWHHRHQQEQEQRAAQQQGASRSFRC